MDALEDAPTPEELARRALATLPFSRPWSIESFIAELGLRINRLIIVEDLPIDLHSEITGLWIPAKRRDVIYVRHDAEGKYREHIICHELAHIVMAHQKSNKQDFLEYLRTNIRRVSPQLPDYMIHRLALSQVCFTRSTHTLHPVEVEAEELATLIMAKADEMRAPLYPDDLPETQKNLLLRLAGMMGWQVQ
ncbi:hypothetical protein G9U53_30735 [Rhodococcus sp. D-46]|jgi:hypothetical protein|uniref:IrrE N-terminal-like domain-containing protein n=3 Tax=Bacteria TaxID=2 RepID=A0A1C4GMK2_RHOSG|nr:MULTISPECIES: hypothetical protein [Rhodococcus]KLN72918.1 hypothetical protein ABM90_03495 [Rhodococcus erythropolis]NHE68691.1 hypothetical protein [Rhodococcus sp. D-46]AZI65524.1 hypothetical protein EHW12_30870 [Rhodococcus sp. NJ-530]KSU67447.1 hypothetical protein AS032_31605 [Rhodococcus qingshengii]MDJ0440359.1 hypothetical protein [Rhodococcus qingshengii]